MGTNWLERAQAVLAPKQAEQPRRFGWVLYRRGLPPLEVRFSPEVTRAEAEQRYPGSRAELAELQE